MNQEADLIRCVGGPMDGMSTPFRGERMTCAVELPRLPTVLPPADATPPLNEIPRCSHEYRYLPLFDGLGSQIELYVSEMLSDDEARYIIERKRAA